VSGGTAPHILDLGTTWRRKVISAQKIFYLVPSSAFGIAKVKLNVLFAKSKGKVVLVLN
jgi:hypothetical protein